MGFWILAGAHSFLGLGLAGWMYGIPPQRKPGGDPQYCVREYGICIQTGCSGATGIYYCIR